MSNIAPHLSEAVYRRWESTLIDAVHSHGCTVHASGLAATTVAAQLRNAIRSLRLYKWQTPLSTAEVEQLEVVVRNDQVAIRYRGTTLTPATTTKSLSELTVESPDSPTFSALCLLLHKQVLQSVVVTNLNQDLLTAAEGYDVVVEPLGNNSYRIL